VPPGFTGSAVWSQIFTSYEKKITDNKGQVHTAVQDCVCPLEDAAPYGPHLTGTANFTPVDSPGVPLLSYLFDAVSVNHTFKMTMLFQPANGIAVPLMAVDWQWQASATNANNLGWQIVGQPINGNPSVSPTTIFPQWNCKINLDPNWNPPL